MVFIPHSPQNTVKIASSLLERDFLLCFATPRRRRGGMCERSEQIPESEGCASDFYIQIRALALVFQLARTPRRAFWDVGAQRRNPSIRTNQTEKWTKFCGSWLKYSLKYISFKWRWHVCIRGLYNYPVLRLIVNLKLYNFVWISWQVTYEAKGVKRYWIIAVTVGQATTLWFHQERVC